MTYFDNSATTVVYPAVLETYDKVTKDIQGNPPSLHKTGDRSHQLLEVSRKQIASLLNMRPYETLFTSSGSESDNWAIKGTALAKKEFGNHIITSSIKHAAVSNSVRALEDLGFHVAVLPVDKDGQANPAGSKVTLDKETILVSTMGVNNEIDTTQPIREISKVLGDYPNVTFYVDNAQALGRDIWDEVFTNRADLMSLSAHKSHAPCGAGIFYKKEGKMIKPLIDGGGQEKGLRSSTENLPVIVIIVKAMRLYLSDKKKSAAQELAVKKKVISYLDGKPGIHIFSPINDKFIPSVLCFSLEGIRGETLVHTSESKEIYVSTTSACSSRSGVENGTLNAMKVEDDLATDAIRLSSDPSNTTEGAEQFISVLDKIYKHFAEINHLK